MPCFQVYHERDLLLGILSSVIKITGEVYDMDANMLSYDLYSALKGHRYLILQKAYYRTPWPA